MAYDEGLAGRVRDRLAGVPGTTEKRMFGGLAFFDEGRMTVCVTDGGLLVRVGKDRTADALARPGARAATMGERTMGGYVEVDAAALDDASLGGWLERARAYARTLPPK